MLAVNKTLSGILRVVAPKYCGSRPTREKI